MVLNGEQVEQVNHMALTQAAALPQYDGKNDLKQFLNKIIAASKIANWTEQQSVDYAIFRLAGTASDYALTNHLSECTTLKQLGEKLADQFIRTVTASEALERFVLAKQRPDESVKDFAFRVQTLGIRTTEHTDEEQREFQNRKTEKAILDKFISGLLPAIKPFVQVSAPSSLQEAVAKAEILQCAPHTEISAFAVQAISKTDEADIEQLIRKVRNSD